MIKTFKYLIFILYVFCCSTVVFAQVKYDRHLAAARATGIPPLKSQAHITSLASKKKLVKISARRGYTIAKLTHSRAYLTPRSYSVLKQIGNTFYSRSKRKTLTVTSVTRTLYDQRRLSRVNSNAVTSKLSSHNFGCSFDISYIRFNKRKAPNARLERMLQDILTQMQRQGKIYFIKEYREKCFHITVR